jgi:outer membrane protein assembly factor BamB
VGWAALAGDPETGNVYAQNVDGQLVGLDRAGKVVWSHRLGEEYGRGSGYGGRTLIPVVDEDRVIVGVVGSILGHFLASGLGIGATGTLGSFIVSLIGAVVLLAILRALGLFK